MKTWTFIDKTQWPVSGPWTTEPDKVQWKDEATGLNCMALRASSNWCGYVGVPENHPAYLKAYDEVDVEVHGSLTFGGLCDPRGHSDIHPRICHVALPGEPEHLYWLGFDCAHSGDLRPPTSIGEKQISDRFPLAHAGEQYRTLDYVQEQCAALAAQLKAMEP